MSLRTIVGTVLMLVAVLPLGTLRAIGQEESPRHGRKYKAPPVTSHVEVTVLKAHNGKPIQNAAVIFRPMKDGKDDGNLEVKTDPDGKAIIDVIATGSEVRVQVIANGYATFGQDYMVDTASKEIEISMLRPRAQVSAYGEKIDKSSERKPGVQEPAKAKAPGVPPAGSTAPVTPPVSPARPESAPASVPGATSPPSL